MEYFLYHRVPKNMRGSILYPLNVLKQLLPDVYKEQVKKYKGRKELLQAEIPPLKCLWNDVLHFTAVEPRVLKANLAKAGIILEPRAWFKVPASLIQRENSIAFTYRRDKGRFPKFKKYEIFDPKRMNVYRVVPHKTIEYYKQKKTEGARPLLFHLVPHILYKGSIDTKNLEIVHS